MRRSALKSAFPQTIPVMAGYIFLGVSYGILMRTAGFPWWLSFVTAIIIYTGSMEFLMVEILASTFHPVTAMVTAFMVGARHLFYGIAMLGKYKNVGWKKVYLIYTTSDETFAVNYNARIPEDVDRGWFYLWVSLLDQSYWVLGSLLGGLLGGLITFQVKGLEFVMTAMFVVIFLNQWTQDGTKIKTMFLDHFSEIIGIVASVVCLLIFGEDNFIIPSMVAILLALTLTRKMYERRQEQ